MATSPPDTDPLLDLADEVHRESRKLQTQARKTNRAAARLREELAKRGIPIKVKEVEAP